MATLTYDRLNDQILRRVRDMDRSLSFEQQNIFAELIGVPRSTYRRWVKQEFKPTGLRFYKLWVYLAEANISSPELMELQPFNRTLLDLYAFDAISLEDALSACNVQNYNDLSAILRGRTPINPVINTKELDEYYGEKLALNRDAVRAKLKLITIAKPAREAQTSPLAEASDPPPPAIDPGPIVVESVPVAVAPEPVAKPTISAVTPKINVPKTIPFVGKRTVEHDPPPSRPLQPVLAQRDSSSDAIEAAKLAASLSVLTGLLLDESTSVKDRELFRNILGIDTLMQLRSRTTALISERERNQRK